MVGIFKQIRPVWIGKILNLAKNFKKLMVGALYFYFHRRFFFNGIGDSALQFLLSKIKVVLDCYYIQFNRPRKIGDSGKNLKCFRHSSENFYNADADSAKNLTNNKILFGFKTFLKQCRRHC
jgi:hypothetical protein